MQSSNNAKSFMIGSCKALLLCGPVVFLTVVLLLSIWNSPSSSSLRVLINDFSSASISELRSSEVDPTNLSHLVFGLLGSEKAWHHRNAYIESWWRPNATVGYLLLDKEPSRELIPWSQASPPYRVSDDVKKIVEETKHVNGRVARMVHGITETVRDAPPGVRWVVMGDDDSIFMVDNMVDILGQYDHTNYYYIGGHSEFILSNYYFSFKQAFGGAGIVMSYPLAKAFANGIMDCLQRYSHLHSADKTTSYCIADLGVNLSPHQGFHQIDMHGDITGFLSFHPNAPLLSLHHFDKVKPIFPSMDKAQSARHLMKSASLDQSRILQQLICFHRPSNWAFTVSWGYSANIYEKIMPRSYLQNPIETFEPWILNSPRPSSWIFDVRKRPTNDSCLVPHAFFLESAEKLESGEEILTTYLRSWRRGLPACSPDGNRSADRISKIMVYSPATKRMKMGRTECCDVTIDSDDVDSAVIRTRECMTDEIIA